MKTLSLYKIKAGTWVSGTIQYRKFTGKIQVEKHGDSEAIFICQNENEGTSCNNKLGFKYSLIVRSGSKKDLFKNSVVIEKIYKTKPKNFKLNLTKSWVIGGYSATEVNGGIKVGCTFVPDSLIKKIAKERNLI